MQRADSLEKTLMLGKYGGRRRWGWQMRWLDSITHSMDMTFNKLWEMVKKREACCAAVHRVPKNCTQLSDWTTKSLSSTPWVQPSGTLLGQTPPLYPLLSLFSEYLDSNIWCIFSKFFLETSTKWKKLTTWWSRAHVLQTSWCLRVDILTPVTPPSSFTLNQSEHYAWADHRPCDLLPYLAF